MTPPIDVIALNRLAFGPGPKDRAAFRNQGLTAWLDDQLGGDHAHDPEADARIHTATLRVKYPANTANDYPAVDETRTLRSLDQPIEANWRLLDPDPKLAPPPERGRPRIEVAAATLIRAVYSRWQLAQPFQRQRRGRQCRLGRPADLRSRRDPPTCAG
jgi:hypothetical protein